MNIGSSKPRKDSRKSTEVNAAEGASCRAATRAARPQAVSFLRSVAAALGRAEAHAAAGCCCRRQGFRRATAKGSSVLRVGPSAAACSHRRQRRRLLADPVAEPLLPRRLVHARLLPPLAMEEVLGAQHVGNLRVTGRGGRAGGQSGQQLRVGVGSKRRQPAGSCSPPSRAESSPPAAPRCLAHTAQHRTQRPAAPAGSPPF